MDNSKFILLLQIITTANNLSRRDALSQLRTTRRPADSPYVCLDCGRTYTLWLNFRDHIANHCPAASKPTRLQRMEEDVMERLAVSNGT